MSPASARAAALAPDAAALERYREQGFLAPLGLLDATEAAAARAAFDRLESEVGRETSVIGLRGRHFDRRFIWDLATHPRLLDWIELLVGPDILLLSTHVFCKYPGTDEGHFVAWHQDTAYWGLEPAEAFTAWIALDDSTVENGAMEVIPGSHRLGTRPHGRADRPNNLLASNQAIADEQLAADGFDPREAVPLVLRAGQFSLHDGALVHGSLPNTSDRRRCGLTARYIRPAVRQVTENNTDGHWRPVTVRGTDTYEHFGVTPAPFPQAGAQ